MSYNIFKCLKKWGNVYENEAELNFQAGFIDRGATNPARTGTTRLSAKQELAFHILVWLSLPVFLKSNKTPLHYPKLRAI